MACTRSTAAPSVIGPGITSTRAISGTGLKKCMPTTRSGLAAAAAMRPTDRLLVLVASRVCGAAAASSSRNAWRFSSRSSGIASTTSSAAARCFQHLLWSDAPHRRVAVAGRELRLLDAPRQEATHPVARLVDRARQRVVQEHLDARGGRDLGDAGPHRAGAQHAKTRDPAAAVSGQ